MGGWSGRGCRDHGLAVPAALMAQREAPAEEQLAFEAATVKRAAPDAVRNRVMPSGPNRPSIIEDRTRSVFDRYNVVSDGDLRDAARRLGHTGGHTSSAVAVSGKTNPQNP